MRILAELRQLSVDAMNLDESVATLAHVRIVVDEFTKQNIPVPEWLGEKHAILARTVEISQRDALMLQLRQAEARRSALKTREERAKQTDQEIDELRKRLGLN